MSKQKPPVGIVAILAAEAAVPCGVPVMWSVGFLVGWLIGLAITGPGLWLLLLAPQALRDKITLKARSLV